MGLVAQIARQVRIVNVFALLYLIITRAYTAYTLMHTSVLRY